jgi:D-apionolactonase
MTAEDWRWLCGTEEPPPPERSVRAGPLNAVLRDGQIGAVRFGDIEVVRGIAFLIRDAGWGTADATIRDLVIDERPDGFTVTYAAHCGDVGAGIDYSVTISGHADGLTMSARAVPEADVLANRIGFVILHPLRGVVGCPMEVEHADGRCEVVAIPALIAPDQPIFDIRALTHDIGGCRVSIRMTGDSYEMEDQRNWCDASLKTYIRPLSKPRPFVAPAGQVIEQSVVLVLGQAEPPSAAAQTVPAQVGTASARLPEIGLALDLSQLGDLPSAREAVAALTPQHLLLRLDQPDAQAGSLCLAADALASAVGAHLSADLIVDGVSPAKELAEYRAVIGSAAREVKQIMPCPRRDLKTRPSGQMPPGEASTAAILRAARAEFPRARIGGGVLSSFTEFNRNPPPGEAMDFLAHGTTAIVHAADDAAVLQTLEALPQVIASARRLAPRCIYRLGPSGIGARNNPYGEGTAANPSLRRVTMARRDPRHFALFGAVWTLAYLAVAAAEAIDQVILADVTGDFGVVATGNDRLTYHPLYHVLRAVSRGGAARAERLALPGSLVGLEFSSPAGRERLLGNATPAAQSLPDLSGFSRVACLDSSTAARAERDPAWLDNTSALGGSGTLGPYALLRLLA